MPARHIDILQTVLADHYRLDREVGRGGMGSVWLAQDLRHDRPVALKVLHPELAATLDQNRFIREIRLTARLQHPHILPVLDSGEIPGEPPVRWFTMPFVDGDSLRGRLDRETRLPVDVAVAIVREVADGLAYAHGLGIVHRDIKPENILLSGEHALLADFGVARMMNETGSGRLTETGLAVGTPVYMSPEQAMGEPVDARTDVYSLASVLYETLVGEPPFIGPNAQAILVARLTAVPRPARAARPDIPEHLDVALSKALQPVAADRYATAAQFREALQGGGRTVPAETGESIAVLPFANLSPDPENEYFADGMTDELISALSRVPQLRVVSRTSAFAFKGKQADVRSVGRQLGVRMVLEGTVRRAGKRLRVAVQLIGVADGFLAWSETFDREMEDVFAIQDEISRAIVTTLKGRIHRSGPVATMVRPATVNLEAYTAYLKGRHFWNRRSEGSVRLGLEYFESALDQDPGYAQALAGIADCYSILGFYCDAPPGEAFPRAKQAAQRALAADPSLAEAHSSLGYVAVYHDWDWDAAEQAYLRSIELNQGYATGHQWYGNFLSLMGRTAEGVASFRHAVSLDPLSALKAAAMGWGLYYDRDYEACVAQCRAAIELDPALAVPHWWVGLASQELGRPDEAVRALTEGSRLSNRNPVALAWLAHVLGTVGRRAEAEALLQELLELSGRRYVSSYDLALVYLGLGDREKALTRLEQGLVERTHWMATLKSDPRMDPMRQEPRFQAIYGQMAFPA